MINQTPVLTVSQLNRQVKHFLEDEIGTLSIEGEISNLSKPSSGHFYFTLKDSTAQLRCVFFKNRHSVFPLKPFHDGQKIIATGKLSLYEARGDYQLIVEQTTEAGLGDLYRQFEALKNKLSAEGLFNASRKKTWPTMPQTIGIITSSSGAAIQDILSTLARRYPIAEVVIYPSEVQGVGAPLQLINALQRANQHNRCDVLILARGGGSLEDLWAFNDEQLARVISESTIPIIAGIGHETDFTIADFVADYRAETPTAAAIAATPDKAELMKVLHLFNVRLHQLILQKINTLDNNLSHLRDKLSSPEKAIANNWQALDYLERHLLTVIQQIVRQKTHHTHLLLSQLNTQNPKSPLQHSKSQLQQRLIQLVQHMKMKIDQCHHQFSSHLSTLHAVSPLATLDRGYAIVTQNKKVLSSTQFIQAEDPIEVRLAEGYLDCDIINIRN